MMKILNLYACLGGNRALWDEIPGLQITAVELDPELCRMYQERFPNDTVINADAHEYLLHNFKDFDFIWSSPPCPTHSRVRQSQKNTNRFIPSYPDMSLYQEIILLNNTFDGLYCVENVIPYYQPLIPAQRRGRHLYWSNFKIPYMKSNFKGVIGSNTSDEIKQLQKFHGIDLSKYKGTQRKEKIARNLVDKHHGLQILKAALGIREARKTNQLELL